MIWHGKTLGWITVEEKGGKKRQWMVTYFIVHRKMWWDAAGKRVQVRETLQHFPVAT